jgi:pimeloyl-ACP methyl ester carboxylesterase
VRTVAAVLTGLVLFSGTAVAAPPWSPQGIEWGPCADFPDSQCGTLRVPLDWSRPHGATVDLAVARHSATDPAHRIGVLLVNPGGPGSSNAEFAAFGGYFSPEVLARFDIVGFDARGTGGSEFIECPTPEGEPGDVPSNEPADAAGFRALVDYNRTAVADCRKANAPVFDHADTGVGAQDMDAVRRALGESKVSYHGISYGTLLGQQYAEKYGSHVRAMVLDSNIDHSVDLRHFLTDRATSAEASFLRFVDWCDADTSCALHGQDVVATWQRAVAIADQYPYPVNPLIDAVFKDLYGPNYVEISDLIAAVAAGESPVSAQFEYNYTSIRLAVVCQDFSLHIKDFRQYSTLWADELRHAPLMRGSYLSHDEAVACLGVDGPPANPPHRLNLSRSPMILLLNSLYDPATPYAWAQHIHAQAPRNTTLLTYEGAGHGVYTRSECTQSATDTYLLTLHAPRQGARCPAV